MARVIAVKAVRFDRAVLGSERSTNSESSAMSTPKGVHELRRPDEDFLHVVKTNVP